MFKSTFKMSSILFLLIGLSSIFSCKKDTVTEEKDYKQEMRNFVQGISAYAKSHNPNFAIIPQNGANLVSKDGDDTGAPDTKYINAIDGIGQEDLFYGYDNDNQATSDDTKNWLIHFLDMAKSNGNVQIMVTDYCSTHSKMDNSYNQNNAKNYLSFAADHRDLDNIPTYPSPIYNENDDTISSLQNAKNFLYLINPDNNFSSKQAFVDAVKNTNYDYIIMDYFYNGEAFTAAQIDSLKQKSNGGRRLLICYMSIGEAENYRYYWQSDWKIGNPTFIAKENPDWAGNYTVKYWEPEWQSIIFGNDNSYLKKILDAGFDGVYLDIIDAFEQFEE